MKIKPAILLLFCFFFLIPSSHAQLFCETVGSTTDEFLNSMIQTNDGGYIAVGYTSMLGSIDCYVVKFSSEGLVEWKKIIGGIVDDDRGEDIVQTNDGGYAIAGYARSFGNGNYDCYIIKLDPNGNLLWSAVYGGQLLDDQAYAIIQSNDGNLVIAGFTNSYGAGNSDCYLLKINPANHQVIWSKTYGGSEMDHAYDVIQTGDGGYALAGISRSIDFGNSGFAYIIKTDPLGNVQWDIAVGDTSTNQEERANSIIQSSDGGYAIAGNTSYYGIGGDMYLIKLNGSGSLQWAFAYGQTDIDMANSVIQTQDGGYLLAGATKQFNTWDICINKVDASGSYQWCKVLGGTLYENASTVVQTIDGGFAIGGSTQSYGAGGLDFYLIKTNVTGYGCCTSPGSMQEVAGWFTDTTVSENWGGIAYDVTSLIDTGGIDTMLCLCITTANILNNDFSVCYGDNFTLKATGGGDYLWSTGATTDMITLSATTSATYSVTVSDSCGTATDSVMVTVTTPPVITTSHIDVSCHGGNDGSANVVVVSGNVSSYLWSNGNTTDNIGNLSAGTYYLTVTDSIGCKTIDTVTINEPPAFTTSFSFSPNMVCHDQTNATASIQVSGGTPPYSYLWSTGGTGTSISGIGAGVYTVTVTDNNGCMLMIEDSLLKFPVLTGMITALDDTICHGECANIQFEILNGNGPYFFAYGTWPQMDTGFIGPVGNTTTFIYCPDVTSLIGVGYIMDMNCGDSVTIGPVEVVVAPSPPPPVVFDDQWICQGDTVYLTANGVGINWYDQDSNLLASNVNNLTISDLYQGTHIIYATQTFPNTGCESNKPDSAIITVIGDKDIDAGKGDTICPDSKIQLHANGGISYHWSPEQWVDNPDIPDPMAFPEEDTWFYVEVTTDSGCMFVDSVLIVIDLSDQCWHVFNAFSPNGDGVNDLWIIKGIENYKNNRVDIFNRWGILVNSIKDYDNVDRAWDGTNFEGAELPEFTYYYILYLAHTKTSGWVQIIR